VFGDSCVKVGIDVSMGSIGDCFDNAVCESFHSTLKRELVYRHSWPTRAELRTAVFEYIEGFLQHHQEALHSGPSLTDNV